MSKQRVLFLCTANSSRSQMAEAILHKYGSTGYEAYSAGLEPKGLNPFMLRVMHEAGYNLAGQYSKSLEEYIGKMTFDYLITVCSDADEKCPFFPGAGTRMHWPFEDPAAFQGREDEKLEKFRQVRDQIELQIRNWLENKSQEL